MQPQVKPAVGRLKCELHRHINHNHLNIYIESFNGKLRDELMNREIFYTLQEAKILVEHWRREYNQIRPHSALGYKRPAPEAVLMPTMTTTLRTGLPQTLT